jgi:hypothetical protein
VQTHGFSEAAFDQVADIGAAQGARGREADARLLSILLPQVESSKVRTGVSLTSVVDESEIAGSEDASTFGEALLLWIRDEAMPRR